MFCKCSKNAAIIVHFVKMFGKYLDCIDKLFIFAPSNLNNLKKCK